MVGDGSYLMLNSEIATSVMLGHEARRSSCSTTAATAASTGCSRRAAARRSTTCSTIACRARRGVPAIDFAAHARSLGALAEHVNSIAELEAALARARAADRTYVVVIDTDPLRTTDGRRLVVGSGAFPRSPNRAERARARESSTSTASVASSHVSREVTRQELGRAHRHQSDLVEQRRPARRSAARRRSKPRSPKARRSATRASSSATSFRASPTRCARCSARHGLALRVGLVLGPARARRRSPRRSPRSRPHLELLAANGAQVMVYGEVADCDPGRDRSRCTQRPRFFRDAQWRDVRRARSPRSARHTLAARRASRLPPPHGRVRRDARGRRPADGESPADEVGLLFDTGHMTFAGGDAADDARRSTSRASATCTARTCGRNVIADGAQPRLELPRVGAQRRVHRARRRRGRFRRA